MSKINKSNNNTVEKNNKSRRNYYTQPHNNNMNKSNSKPNTRPIYQKLQCGASNTKPRVNLRQEIKRLDDRQTKLVNDQHTDFVLLIAFMMIVFVCMFAIVQYDRQKGDITLYDLILDVNRTLNTVICAVDDSSIKYNMLRQQIIEINGLN